MLQSFLDEELLLNIGDEGEKFAALEKAAPAIAKSLLDNRSKILTFTLVALDPEAAENEPAFSEIEAAVKIHWKTLRNKYKEMTRQLFRAVIWEALEQVGNADEHAAAVIWLTGSAYLPYAKLEERAVPLCSALLQQMGVKMEKRASQDWALNTAVEVTKLPAWNIKLAGKPQVLSLELFTKEIAAAVGPNDLQGVAITNANPYSPNQGATWSTHFTPRVAKAIAGAVDAMGKAVLDGLQPLEGALQKHGAAINLAVQKSMEAAVGNILAQQRRSALMWWKETLFSESRRRGYRGLESAELALLMAYDLHQMVPSFSPQSVEFLLKETVRVAAVQAERVTLQELLTGLQSDPHKLRLGESLPDMDGSLGRLPLLGFIQQMLTGKLELPAFAARAGLKLEDKIEVDDFAVWIFRDLQAQSCVEE